MEQDDPAEALTELRERQLGALELLQAAAGSGLAAYMVWALLLQPGFRRVPLRLQVRGGARPGRGARLPLRVSRSGRGRGALRRRERGAGGARVVAAARPPRKNGGSGLWRRQDRAGGPQVRPPPGRGLRAEPLAGGAGAAARLEGWLCRQRLLSPQGSLEGNLGIPGHPLTAQGAVDTCEGWGPGLGSCHDPVPTGLSPAGATCLPAGEPEGLPQRVCVPGP
nr:adenine nucleotide translocase lysine N-methyltransferase isoform X3 [Symphalangus syndactylus]